jgi:hypothetical protein
MSIAWNPELDAKLCEKYRYGWTLTQVSDDLGISFSAVRRRAIAMNLPIRPRGWAVRWTPEMDAKLYELRADGYGYEAAAKVIGVANGTVRHRVKALGLPVWGKGGGRKRVSYKGRVAS